MKKMKKLIVAILLFIGCYSNTNAQTIQKGDVLIDGYYGLINSYSNTYTPLFIVVSPDIITNKSTDPIGFRIESMETEKFGLGLDVAYNASEVTYTSDYNYYYNSFASSGIDTTTGKKHINTYKSKKNGALLSFNFHFVTTDKLDAYMSLGIGYDNRKIQESITDPTVISSNRTSLLSISEKFGLGIRYFFTPKIGEDFAFNLGQRGLLNFGLTMKQ
jgi:hypothetical protein